MDQLGPGDTLVVWKLDRLGRNMLHILETVKTLTEMGVRHLRRAGSGQGNRRRGVQVVGFRAGPHFTQDGSHATQRLGQPSRTALGRCGCG